MFTHNDQSLEELETLLLDCQGEFCLIFAICNFNDLQSEKIKQLTQIMSGHNFRLNIKSVPRNIKSLYSFCEKQNSSSETFDCLAITDLNKVNQIDTILTSANQIREKFKKQFYFPIVIWINNELLVKFIRQYHDFESWAYRIRFEQSLDKVQKSLQQTIDLVFDSVIHHRENIFLDKTLQQNSQLYTYAEVVAARNGILEEQLLSEEQKGNIEFILGYLSHQSYLQSELEKAESHYKKSLDIYQEINHYKNCGIASHYLGLIYLTKSVRNHQDRIQKARVAKDYFKQSIFYFEQGDFLYLKVKFFNFLLVVCHLLGITTQQDGYWNELETLAQEILKIYDSSSPNTLPKDPFREAMIKGLLAEVERNRKNWIKSEQHAQQAYNLFEEARHNIQETEDFLNIQDKFNQVLYLFTLGVAIWEQAKIISTNKRIQQEKIKVSIKYLTKADRFSEPNYAPWLSIQIQDYLNKIYYFQGLYRKAFTYKLEKRSKETEFGFRAFIGAKKLKPDQEQINPALSPSEFSENISQAIQISSYNQDLFNIVKRLRNKKRLTIIYGSSGIGKSSFIEAGLIPKIKNLRTQNGYRFKPVLINHYEKCLDNILKEIQIFPNIKFIQKLNFLYKQIDKNFQQKTILVFIFDQFESLFLNTKNNNKEKVFFQFLANCISLEKTHGIRVILSLRKDYFDRLLDLEKYLREEYELVDIQGKVKTEASMLNIENHYQLNNISAEDAKKIIKALTEQANLNWNHELIERIVKDLQDSKHRYSHDILLIELQVICSQIEEDKITRVDEYNDLQTEFKSSKIVLIEKYINSIINDCGIDKETRKIARAILYFLTNSQNIRSEKTEQELSKELKLYFPYYKNLRKKVKEILSFFKDSNLISVVQEIEEKYQLIHDYFVTFVRDISGEEIRKELEDVQKELIQNNKKLENTVWILKIMIAALIFFILLTNYQKQQIKLTELITDFYLLSKEQKQIKSRIKSVQASQLADTWIVNLFESFEEKLLQKNASLQKNTLRNLYTATLFSQEKYRKSTENSHVFKILADSNNNTFYTFNANSTILKWTINNKNNKVIMENINNDKELLIDQASLEFNIGRKEDQSRSFVSSIENKTVIFGSPNQLKLWHKENREWNEKQTISLPPVSDQEIKQNCSNNDGLQSNSDVTKLVRTWGIAITNNWVASSGEDCQITIWELKENEINPEPKQIINHESNSLDKHNDIINSLAFIPIVSKETQESSLFLASASDDGTIKLWKYNSQSKQNNKFEYNLTLKGHHAKVNDVTFNSDNQLLASADSQGKIILWSINFNSKTPEIRWRKVIKTTNFITRIRFISEDLLVSGSQNGQIQIWDIKNSSTPKIYRPQFNNYEFLNVIVAQGSYLSYSKSKKAHRLGILTNDDNNPNKLATKLYLWDIETKQQIENSLENFPNNNEIRSVYFNPINAEEMAVGFGKKAVTFENEASVQDKNQRGKVIIWKDNKYFQTLESSQKVDSPIISLAYSPDGNSIAAGRENGEIIFWERDSKGQFNFVSNKSNKSNNLHHQKAVYNIRFSDDGKWIASASADGKIHIYIKENNLYKKTTLSCENLGTAAWYSLTFNKPKNSSDSLFLFAGNEQGQIVRWKYKSQSKKWDCNPQANPKFGFDYSSTKHTSQIYYLSFSPEHQLLTSASKDGTIKIWNLQGELLSTVYRGDFPVLFADWTEDGDLIMLDLDRTVKLTREEDVSEELSLAQLSIRQTIDIKGQLEVTKLGSIRVWDNLLTELRLLTNQNIKNNKEQILRKGCQKTRLYLNNIQDEDPGLSALDLEHNEIQKLQKFCNDR